MQQVYNAEIAQLEFEAAMIVAEQEARARAAQLARERAEERRERERAKEALRAKQARRRLLALTKTAGGCVPGPDASAAAWAERQAESAWYFGPVRRRGAY